MLAVGEVRFTFRTTGFNPKGTAEAEMKWGGSDDSHTVEELNGTGIKVHETGIGSPQCLGTEREATWKLEVSFEGSSHN